jgi:hypothetical protein
MRPGTEWDKPMGERQCVGGGSIGLGGLGAMYNEGREGTMTEVG